MALDPQNGSLAWRVRARALTSSVRSRLSDAATWTLWQLSDLHPRIQAVQDQVMRANRRFTLNRLCDISDFRAGEELSKTIRDLNEGGHIHRKSWEYAMCVSGLRTLGLCRPDARALAVGAGSERPLYWFANN